MNGTPRYRFFRACDPLLALLHYRCRLSRGQIGLCLLGLFAVTATASGLWPVVWGDGGERVAAYAALICYPLFILNAMLAFTYYQSLPTAWRELVRGDFFHPDDRPAARKLVRGLIRKRALWVARKNFVIFAFTVVLVGGFHLAYLASPDASWVKARPGVLSLAGWLHAFYVGAMAFMAFQFIACVFTVGVVLFRLQRQVLRQELRVRPWRLAYPPGARPIVRLFWLGASTLVPLFIFSVVLAVQSRHGDGWSPWHSGVFFPLVYCVATPLMFVGHLYPIHRIIDFEKRRLVDHYAAEDIRLMPCDVTEARRSLSDDTRPRVEALEKNEKLFERAQQIPTFPLNLGKLTLLALPPMVDVALKFVLKE